jgi:chemotaxis protein histidine kinase CheA
MAADTADDFQKELVDLFVEEAHEWLQNIHVALDELQQGPTPQHHIKLVEIMLAGVTNLAGSAATINLPDVQQASSAAVPFIEAFRDPLKAFSVQDFFALCRQLGQIHAALTRATGLSFEGDGSCGGNEAHTSLSPPGFLQALQRLQEKQSSLVGAGRNRIDSLIDQVEGQVQAGVERLDVGSIQEYLMRMSEAEESFLKSIDEQVPEIVKKMSALKMTGGTSSCLTALEASLLDVARLCTEAQQVNAGSAIMFFTGLHSLLTVVTRHGVHLAASRVESVTARLHMVDGAIRQWVEHGRIQRAAIDRLLLPAMPDVLS